MPAGRTGRLRRLPERKSFQRVFSQGGKQVGENLILWFACGQQHEGARLGLSVSAKVGSSVRRNRLKRLAREAFRLNRDRLPAYDLVVLLRPGCRWRNLAEAERDFLQLCARGKLLNQ